MRDEAATTLGTEFVGTSRLTPAVQTARQENPRVKFFDGRPGGYARCGLDAQRWKSDPRLVESP